MEDFTQLVIDFLKQRFPGHAVFQPLTTFRDNTSTNFGVRTGNEIKARGSATIGNFVSHQGALKRFQAGNLTLWFTEPHITLTFRYTSQTHGERWLWPGGVFVDNVWNDLHPQGTVTGILRMVPQENAVLRLEIMVEPGHPDDPNNFIKDRVVPQTLGKLDALLEEFTGKSILT